MQRDVLEHQKDILETDRSATLEVAFLLQKVHVVADAWAQNAYLNILTGPAGEPTSAADIPKILVALNKLSADPRRGCVPATTKKDLEAVETFVGVLGGPTSTSQSQPGTGTQSHFVEECLQIAATWLRVQTTTKALGGSMFGIPMCLTGAAAAAHMHARIKAVTPDERSEQDLMMLRSYRWLLPVAAQDEVETWVQAYVRLMKAKIINQKMLGDAKSDETGAASSSSTAIVSTSFSAPSTALVSSIADITAGKKSKPIVDSKKQSAAKLKMMSIFCGGK
jgi:hypothetical protein